MTQSLAESLPGMSPIAWARNLLIKNGWLVNATNLQVIYSWMYAESGGGGGLWNPLNTVQPWPLNGPSRTTNYNSTGVKNYVSYIDGLEAVSNVLHNSTYSGIRFALTAGNDTQDISQAITNSIWGTHFLPLKPLPPGTIGEEMQYVPSPHKPLLPGRSPACRWDPADPYMLRLENGARLENDFVLLGTAGVHLLRIPVQSGLIPTGIAPSIALNGVNRGKYDGKGVLVFTNAQDTYNFYWSNLT